MSYNKRDNNTSQVLTHTYKNVTVSTSIQEHINFANRHKLLMSLDVFHAILESDEFHKLISLARWPVGYDYGSELFLDKLIKLPLKAQKTVFLRLKKIKANNETLKEYLKALASEMNFAADINSFSSIFRYYGIKYSDKLKDLRSVENASHTAADTSTNTDTETNTVASNYTVFTSPASLANDCFTDAQLSAQMFT